MTCHDPREVEAWKMLEEAAKRAEHLITLWINGPIFQAAGIKWKDEKDYPPTLIKLREALAELNAIRGEKK